MAAVADCITHPTESRALFDILYGGRRVQVAVPADSAEAAVATFLAEEPWYAANSPYAVTARPYQPGPNFGPPARVAVLA